MILEWNTVLWLVPIFFLVTTMYPKVFFSSIKNQNQILIRSAPLYMIFKYRNPSGTPSNHQKKIGIIRNPFWKEIESFYCDLLFLLVKPCILKFSSLSQRTKTKFQSEFLLLTWLLSTGIPQGPLQIIRNWIEIIRPILECNTVL